jgi:hypothetical protein
MYDALRPWLGVRLAELGAGRGNLSVHFVAHARVMLTDQHPTHVAMLRERWGQRANVEVHQADMTVPQDLRVLRELSPDTVVFTNVLEHIANDGQVLRDLHALVPSGCRLVVLVPYDLRLYTPFDKAVGHFRRYGEGELERKMTEAGFMVEHQQYFNKAGWPGHWCSRSHGNVGSQPGNCASTTYSRRCSACGTRCSRDPGQAPSWWPERTETARWSFRENTCFLAVQEWEATCGATPSGCANLRLAQDIRT